MNASWAQTRLNISPSGPSRRSQNIYPVRLWSGVGIEIVRGSLPHSRAGRSVVRGKEGCASIFLRYLAESLGNSGIKIHVLVPSSKKENQLSRTALPSIAYKPTAQHYSIRCAIDTLQYHLNDLVHLSLNRFFKSGLCF